MLNYHKSVSRFYAVFLIIVYMSMETEVAAAEAEERVVARARQIVNSLGSSESMTRDMLTILSTFHIHVFSLNHQNPGNPSAKSADLEANLASADRIISFWDSKSCNPTLFVSIPKESNEYLAAVDSLRHLMEIWSSGRKPPQCWFARSA